MLVLSKNVAENTILPGKSPKILQDQSIPQLIADYWWIEPSVAYFYTLQSYLKLKYCC